MLLGGNTDPWVESSILNETHYYIIFMLPFIVSQYISAPRLSNPLPRVTAEAVSSVAHIFRWDHNSCGEVTYIPRQCPQTSLRGVLSTRSRRAAPSDSLNRWSEGGPPSDKPSDKKSVAKFSTRWSLSLLQRRQSNFGYWKQVLSTNFVMVCSSTRFINS